MKIITVKLKTDACNSVTLLLYDVHDAAKQRYRLATGCIFVFSEG